MSASVSARPAEPADRADYRPLSPWLAVGRGGWTIHFLPHREGRISYGVSTLSHYGDTWREHLDELAPSAVGTDTRPMREEDVITFSVAGPMGDPSGSGGCMKRLDRSIEQCRDFPVDGREPRFGDARSLDCVALDVYVTILCRFGGRVFDPHRS